MADLNFENIVLPDGIAGFVKIWKIDDKGNRQLVVDKRNMVLYRGADVLARCLAGAANSKISHLYLAFRNNSAVVTSPAKADTTFTTGAEHNYLRVPLTLPASYTASGATYANNIVVFSIVLNNAEAYRCPAYAALSSGESQFYGAGLAACGNATENILNHPSDQLFSKLVFDAFTYTSADNLAVSWGVKITS
jgi:hypothetical protein